VDPLETRRRSSMYSLSNTWAIAAGGMDTLRVLRGLGDSLTVLRGGLSYTCFVTGRMSCRQGHSQHWQRKEIIMFPHQTRFGDPGSLSKKAISGSGVCLRCVTAVQSVSVAEL
jgi:hypothetical protein